MTKLRNLFLTLIFLVANASAWAEMTVYFKDGTSREVEKIQFNDELADLHLSNGMVLSVAVNTIDLPSSGIFNPVGTYGGSEFARSAEKPQPPAKTSSPAEQSHWKKQWETATQKAIAIDSHGPVEKGAEVRVLQLQSATVTILYLDENGNYRKMMIDNSGFYDNFEFVKEAPSSSPVKYSTGAKNIRDTESLKPQMPTSVAPPNNSSVTPLVSEAAVEKAAQVTRRAAVKLPLFLGFAVIGLIIVLSIVIIRKQNSYQFDPSRISKCEPELRQVSVPQWLAQGKTTKDLIELCLNRFYESNPKLLGLTLRMIDGDPKSLVVASMLRQGVKTSVQAELLYDQLKTSIDVSNSIVQEVSSATGGLPLDQRRMSSNTNASIARASAVARPAGVPRAVRTQQIQIVSRPVVITACSLLLFLSAAITAVLLFGNFPGLEKLREMIGTPGLIVAVVYTAACAYGYWTMRKWAVLLYAVEPLLRWWADVPGHLIALPVFIVAAGIIYFDEMTWS